MLLRWGVNSLIQKAIPGSNFYMKTHSISVFKNTVWYGSTKSIHLLKELYPKYLQENWLVLNHLSNWYEGEYFEKLDKERKNSSHLDVLCISEIFYQLGYNPVPKAENLPLPRKLIDFVQGKDIDGLHM